MGGDVDLDGNTLDVSSGEIIGAASIVAQAYKGGADQDLTIKSDGNMIFVIDNDSDETGQAFSFKNNATTEIANLDESGNLQLDGVITAKQYHYINANFFDDIGTSLHYIPLGAPINEQSIDGSSYTDFICPCNLKVLSIELQLPASVTGGGDITMTVLKSDVGAAVGTKSAVEAETLTMTAANDNDQLHFLFDNAALTAKQAMAISIQSDTDLSSNAHWFVTVVIEMDWSTRNSGSSAVITS